MKLVPLSFLFILTINRLIFAEDTTLVKIPMHSNQGQSLDDMYRSILKGKSVLKKKSYMYRKTIKKNPTIVDFNSIPHGKKVNIFINKNLLDTKKWVELQGDSIKEDDFEIKIKSKNYFVIGAGIGLFSLRRSIEHIKSTFAQAELGYRLSLTENYKMFFEARLKSFSDIEFSLLDEFAKNSDKYYTDIFLEFMKTLSNRHTIGLGYQYYNIPFPVKDRSVAKVTSEALHEVTVNFHYNLYSLFYFRPFIGLDTGIATGAVAGMLLEANLANESLDQSGIVLNLLFKGQVLKQDEDSVNNAEVNLSAKFRF